MFAATLKPHAALVTGTLFGHIRSLALLQRVIARVPIVAAGQSVPGVKTGALGAPAHCQDDLAYIHR